MADDEIRDPQISISKIPVPGGPGAALAIIILLSAMLVALPVLRWPTALGVLGGVLLAVVLIVWRRYQPPATSHRRITD